jgi:hypothetical protein
MSTVAIRQIDGRASNTASRPVGVAVDDDLIDQTSARKRPPAGRLSATDLSRDPLEQPAYQSGMLTGARADCPSRTVCRAKRGHAAAVNPVGMTGCHAVVPAKTHLSDDKVAKVWTG